ncbi:MAG: PEP-CTERM sorting domain-containing protein [Limisphaerales bacterium]
MKKSIILGILGLAVGVASSYGQGAVFMDNYISSGPFLTFSSDLGGGLLTTGYTVGLYYGPANTDISGSVLADPSNVADPLALDASFTLATGVNSTAPILGSGAFSGGSFLIQPAAGTVSVPQNSYTLMVVAYNGADYDDSSIRGHSTPFYVEDAATDTTFGADIGSSGLQAFSVYTVPEPTTLALAGLGLASLLAIRRKKA